MTIDELEALLAGNTIDATTAFQADLAARMTAAFDAYRAELGPTPVSVPAGGDLQAALDAYVPGTEIVLEAGATYTADRYRVTRTGTRLRGQGASLHGTGWAALHVLPGVHDVQVRDILATSDHPGAVILLGDNSSTTQGSLELVPRDIVLDGITIPEHINGKRGIEVNAVATLRNLDIQNVWVAGQDNQAIGILNTPGPVTVEDFSLSSGGEIVMVGGDSLKIPGVWPCDLTFRRGRLWRPLTWQTDGVSRTIKNSFELKAGERVLVEDVEIDGNWADAQTNGTIVLTPRNGANVADVTFRRLTVRNTYAAFNVLGWNDSTTQPPHTRPCENITVVDSHFTLDRVAFGGTSYNSRFLLLQRGAGRFEVTNTRVLTDMRYHDLIRASDRYAPVGPLVLQGNRWLVPYYTSSAIPFPCPDNAVDTWFPGLVVDGNTIGDTGTATKTRWPANTFLTADEWHAQDL